LGSSQLFYKRKIGARSLGEELMTCNASGGGGLLSERLVAFGSAPGKATLEVGYETFGIG